MYQLFDRSFGSSDRTLVFPGAYGTSNAAVASYGWNIPAIARFVYIIAIGAGASGGGGSAAAVNNAAGGGGTGSVGSWEQAFYAAPTLPKTIYIFPGTADTSGRTGQVQGGAAAGLGRAGGDTVIAMENNPSASVYLLKALGGVAGASNTAGGSGANSAANCYTTSLFTVNVGSRQPNGISGTSGSVGTASTWGTTNGNGLLLPGASGGGVNASNTTTAGGAIVMTATTLPNIAGGIAGGGAGGNGFSNYFNSSSYPLMFVGGSGGGANNSSGTGGKGGDGGYGCSGGGGGASNGAGSIGGLGGLAGPGLVLIYWF